MPKNSNNDFNNHVVFTVQVGDHKGKRYLFKESTKRFSLMKVYVANRKDQFKNNGFFLISGLQPNGKWEFSHYSNKTFTNSIPLPEVIYDIDKDKIYVLKGQLWEIR